MTTIKKPLSYLNNIKRNQAAYRATLKKRADEIKKRNNK